MIHITCQSAQETVMIACRAHHRLIESGLKARVNAWLLLLLLPCWVNRHTAIAAAGHGTVLLLVSLLLLTAPLLHSLLLQLLRRLQHESLHTRCWLHPQLLRVLPAINAHRHCHIAGYVCQGVAVALVEEQQLTSSPRLQPAAQPRMQLNGGVRLWRSTQ
jgi:hypothetical protein